MRLLPRTSCFAFYEMRKQYKVTSYETDVSKMATWRPFRFRFEETCYLLFWS